MNEEGSSHKVLRSLGHLYLLILLFWLVGWLTVGDRIFFLFLLNTFAFYLFLPAPFLCAYGLFSRTWKLAGGGLAALLLGIWLFGALWRPALLRPAFWRPVPPVAGPALNLLSYNLNGANYATEAVASAIEETGADLILLQELNSTMAAHLAGHFAASHPYQLLQPEDGVRGLGILSRYPLQATGETLPPHGWLGAPQIAQLQWEHSEIRLINLHTMPPQAETNRWMNAERLQRSQALLDYANAHPEPLLVGGDFNMTDMSDSYQLLTEQLQDSWRAAGSGLGHTYGLADVGADGLWLIRIDYFFISSHWQVRDAHIPTADGYSDHRPVFTTVVLQTK